MFTLIIEDTSPDLLLVPPLPFHLIYVLLPLVLHTLAPFVKDFFESFLYTLWHLFGPTTNVDVGILLGDELG
jgi:hypothetical protein